MNLVELATSVAEEQKLAPGRVRQILNATFAKIAAAMAAGEEVTVEGLGRFRVVPFEAHERHDQATGAMTTVPAGRRPVFTPAKPLRDKLNPAEAA